jgi:hypothetical protein
MNRGTRRQMAALKRDSRFGRNPRRSAHLSVAFCTALTICSVLAGKTVLAESVGNHVKDVKIVAQGPETDIQVTGTASAEYNVVVDDGGNRLLIDLANADVAGAKAALTEPVGVVGGVLTQELKAEGAASARTRLVVSLTRHASFRVRRDGTNLHITLRPADFTKVDDTPLPAAAVPQATVISPEIKEVRFERVAPTSFTTARAPSDAPACANGCDRVVVALSAMPSYALSTTASGNVRLELKNARVKESAARTVDVSSYQGFLHTVASFYDVGDSTAVVEIGRTGDSQGTVTVDGTNLVWTFELPKAVRASLAKAAGQTQPGKEDEKGSSRSPVRVDAPDLPKIETSILRGHPTAWRVATTGGGAAGFASGVNGQVERARPLHGSGASTSISRTPTSTTSSASSRTSGT